MLGSMCSIGNLSGGFVSKLIKDGVIEPLEVRTAEQCLVYRSVNAEHQALERNVDVDGQVLDMKWQTVEDFGEAVYQLCDRSICNCHRLVDRSTVKPEVAVDDIECLVEESNRVVRACRR